MRHLSPPVLATTLMLASCGTRPLDATSATRLTQTPATEAQAVAQAVVQSAPVANAPPVPLPVSAFCAQFKVVHYSRVKPPAPGSDSDETIREVKANNAAWHAACDARAPASAGH